jgi:hypothetical protein
VPKQELIALIFNISGLRWVGKTSDLKNLSCQTGFVLPGRTLSWFRGFSEDVVKYRFLNREIPILRKCFGFIDSINVGFFLQGDLGGNQTRRYWVLDRQGG